MNINSWKFLFGSGVLGLILSSIIIMIVLYFVKSSKKKLRKLSLRDQHIEQISRFGGIGLCWGFLISFAILWFLIIEETKIGIEFLPKNRIAGLCVGAMLAWLIGLVDDLVNLRARWKLFFQIILSFFAIGMGFNIESIQLPILQIVDLGSWSWLITSLWIIGIINAINLIDGLDGLASSLSIVALICLGIICWWEGQNSLIIIICTLIGGTIGFLSFNRPQASIFMGDSGSMFLGFSLATLSIWVTDLPGRGPSVIPVLIFAVPILDTGFALFRRFFKGIPFYSADKDHLHHRLIYRGFTSTQAMLILIVFSILFGVLALMAHRIMNFWGFAFLLGISLAYILLYWLGYEEIRNPINKIKEQTDFRKRRTLLLALSDNIEEFFAKDPDSESVFRSFKYWTLLAGVSRFEIKLNNKIVFQSGEEDSSCRNITFKVASNEVIYALPKSSWSIDSDLKGDLLENVSIALIKRLEQL